MSEEDKNGRMSWDQTAIYVASLRYDIFFNLEEGKMTVADDGATSKRKFLPPSTKIENMKKLYPFT